ncbi:Transcriptional regulatory protein ZraR [compost metagenome]
MNRIMVVDDEAIQRRVLGQMIREILPDCEVFEANNGKIALDIVRSTVFDVIITDIKMPIMDGFGFIEHMNEISADTKIIILSSYRYFEYAQRALRLGAFDYLLKPVKEENICLLLQKVQESIEQEKRMSSEQEILSKQLHSSMNVYYEHLLQEWIQNGLSHARFMELQRQYSFGPCGAVIVTRMEDGDPADLPAARLEGMRKALPVMLASLLDPAYPAVSFFSPKHRMTMISIVTAKHPSEVMPTDAVRALEEYSQRLSAQYPMSFTVGVGNVRTDFGHEAGHSYKEALEAADFRYFLSGERVIQYSGLSGLIAPMHYDFHKDEELFKEAIRAMKSEMILRLTDDLFSRVLENGLPYREQWLQSIVHLVFHIAPAVKGFLSEEDYRSMLSEAESGLTSCANYGDCKKQFSEIMKRFMTILQSNRAKKHETIIEKCLNYIDLHYKDDISLDFVANQLFFSPNYLSVIFKNYLGVSFTKYLSDIRLKKAVHLLEIGDMKVYEIAGKVGFKDEKYFYRVFKTKFGVTPDEYRKNYAFQLRRE